MPVSGNDQISFRGERAGQYLIVVRVFEDSRRNGGWVHYRRQQRIALDKLFDRQLRCGELARELGPSQDVGEFQQQCGASEKTQAFFAGRLQQLQGHTTPQQPRDYDVSVENNAHDLARTASLGAHRVQLFRNFFRCHSQLLDSHHAVHGLK